MTFEDILSALLPLALVTPSAGQPSELPVTLGEQPSVPFPALEGRVPVNQPLLGSLPAAASAGMAQRIFSPLEDIALIRRTLQPERTLVSTTKIKIADEEATLLYYLDPAA